MNVATAKVEAANIPKEPVNFLAGALTLTPAFCLLVLSTVLELNAALGTGRYCNDLAGVRTARGKAAAVKQRSLQKLCAACMLTKVSKARAVPAAAPDWIAKSSASPD